MRSEGHFPRLSEGCPPTFVPAVNRKRARVDGPLNRVGDSQVCRFSLVTEYSYKDRGNNPVVDVTCYSNR